MQDPRRPPLSAGTARLALPTANGTAPSRAPDDSTDRGSTLEAALRQQRPVICAVDNDDLAAGVLATAAVLAAQLAVPLTVIHSPDPDVFLVGEPRRAALERGNAFVDELADGYTVDERVVELDDPARLVTAVAQEGATMVVIGTRRRTGLRAALLGSVSQSRHRQRRVSGPDGSRSRREDESMLGQAGAGDRRRLRTCAPRDHTQSWIAPTHPVPTGAE